MARAGGPLLVVVGASFAAGVGPGGPLQAWPVELARSLGWRALVAGVPGIGYAHVGEDHLGPLGRLTATLGLPALHPSLVVVQVGHDDWRVPPTGEARRVGAHYRGLLAALPGARLATVTVFAARSAAPARRARLEALDRAIIGAARSADPRMVVMDPLGARWSFARETRGGLHPSAAGDRQIAASVLAALTRHGAVAPPGARRTRPPVCDLVAPGAIRRPRATRSPTLRWTPRGGLS